MGRKKIKKSKKIGTRGSEKECTEVTDSEIKIPRRGSLRIYEEEFAEIQTVLVKWRCWMN